MAHDAIRRIHTLDAAGRLKLGFQARQTHEVVDIAACPVLPAHVSALLPSLQSMLAQPN